MASAWLELLNQHGWLVLIKECCWITNLADTFKAPSVVSRDITVERRGRKQGFKALGCIITTDGRETTELAHREAQFMIFL